MISTSSTPEELKQQSPGWGMDLRNLLSTSSTSEELKQLKSRIPHRGN